MKSDAPRAEKGGMDEGNPATRKWLQRLVNIGNGPPQGDVIDREFGKLVIDEKKSRYFETKHLFASLSQEVDEMKEIIEQEDDDGEESSVEHEQEQLPDLFLFKPPVGHQSFLFGYSSSDVDLKPLHPLPSQIPFFWDSYVENVDPLTKIFHVPTMAICIREATKGWNSLHPSMEVAMFSIYYAVISCLSQEEVMENFNTDKRELLAKYRFGVEQALTKANFLVTTNIVTIQAFVLFIFCLRRHEDSKLIWSLTGIAVRIGTGIGLHRDGTELGLSPFDTDMRRRLWWIIQMLDFFTSEDSGMDAMTSDETSDTKLPLNINDTDIELGSKEFPKERVGATDVTFVLVQHEILKVSRKICCRNSYPFGRMGQQLSIQEKEKLARELHNTLEEKYIKYCLDVSPLLWVCATLARLASAIMSVMPFLRSNKCPDDFPEEVRDRLFLASIEMMEYSRLLESGQSTKKWGWMFHTYIQWSAIVYLLRELCRRPGTPLLERAWRAVDSVFTSWDQAVKYSRSAKNGKLWLPLKRLYAKARAKREADVAKGLCLGVPLAYEAKAYDDRKAQAAKGGLNEHQSCQQAAQQFGNEHDIDIPRPLAQGIPRPDPNAMPDIYASAPFSPSLWDQRGDVNHDTSNMPDQQHPQFINNYSEPSLLQSQFQNFSEHHLYQQQPQAHQNDSNGFQPQQQHVSWLMEAPAADLDMSGVGYGAGSGAGAGASGAGGQGQDDFNWEGIDDLLRDMGQDTGQNSFTWW